MTSNFMNVMVVRTLIYTTSARELIGSGLCNNIPQAIGRLVGSKDFPINLFESISNASWIDPPKKSSTTGVKVCLPVFGHIVAELEKRN
ncbi:hypothetical protein A4A49_57739, partial [Nicotiana attenuata]